MNMRWGNVKQLHFGNQVNYDMQLEFCNLFGFDKCTKFSKPFQLKNFVEGKHGYNNSSKGYDVSLDTYFWADHGEAFKSTSDNGIMVIGHLYRDMSDAFKKVNEVVKPIGLRAVIFNAEASWYYPKSSTMVAIMSDDFFKSNEHLFNKVTNKYLTI